MASTALITGGNRGIGQQVASVLATDGWHVIIGARDRQKGDAAAKRLRKATGGRVRAVELDVADDASVATAAQKLRDGALRIDALVNNAGIYNAAGKDAVERTLATNFFGPLRVTLALLPLLRDGGSITNVTSGLGALARLDAAHRRMLGDPELTRDALVAHVTELARGGAGWGADVYAASKVALNVLTRLLAEELAPRRIRVNATDPGWVRSDMGGRGAPRSIEQGAASVLFGVSTMETGGVFHDGARRAP